MPFFTAHFTTRATIHPQICSGRLPSSTGRLWLGWQVYATSRGVIKFKYTQTRRTFEFYGTHPTILGEHSVRIEVDSWSWENTSQSSFMVDI